MIPIKNDREIEKMRQSCKTASVILDRVSSLLRPGIATRDVDQAAADFMAEEKCRSAFLGYKKFPGHICISINEEVVHGIGGNRRVQYGDIVKLDIGVIKDGWVGDTATTVPIGVIDTKTQRLLQVTEDTLDLAITYAHSGRRLGDLCSAIEDEIIANGYSVVREFVGHGVGRKLHEEPQVPNYGRAGSGPKLKPGMTIAIEPMVNMGGANVRVLGDNWTVVTEDGKPSAHFEHTVLITKGEPEILTWRERALSKSLTDPFEKMRLRLIRMLPREKVLIHMRPCELAKGESPSGRSRPFDESHWGNPIPSAIFCPLKPSNFTTTTHHESKSIR